MAERQAWEGKPLQLHGYVVPGLDPAQAATRSSTGSRSRTTRPAPANPGDVVDVSYTGIVPDTFKDEAEVVLKGQLGAGRVPRRSRTASWRSVRRSTKRAKSRVTAPQDRTMASLGSFLLLAAFVVCSYAAVISVVGARRGSRG